MWFRNGTLRAFEQVPAGEAACFGGKGYAVCVKSPYVHERGLSEVVDLAIRETTATWYVCTLVNDKWVGRRSAGGQPKWLHTQEAQAIRRAWERGPRYERPGFALYDPQRLDPDAPKAQLNLGDEQNPLNQQVQAGEKVTIRENIHEKGLKNGQSGTVQSVRKDGSVLVSVENERGRQFNVRLSKDQLENGVAALRYTSTVHKSQGQTLERGLYVHDPSSGNVDRHLVYPAMTRGKESNEVLLVGDQDEAKQDLAHAMSRSDQDTLRVASHRAQNPQPDEEKVQQQVQEFAQEEIPVSEETVRESFYEEERRKADLGFKALIEQERKKVLTESRKAILRRREQNARRQETEREKIQRRRQAPRMQQKVA